MTSLITLDLPVKTLDDLFDNMEVLREMVGMSGRRPRPAAEPGFFFKWVNIPKGRLIYATPKSEIHQRIQRSCINGHIGCIRPVEQYSAPPPGQYAIIAEDKEMISSIRVCLLDRSAMTFKGVDVLSADLTVGKIGITP